MTTGDVADDDVRARCLAEIERRSAVMVVA
jgi:hypothetical protein